MATARTNLSDFDLPGARLRSRSLHRLGAGLLTGAAASLSLVLSPVTATAAETSSSTAGRRARPRRRRSTPPARQVGQALPVRRRGTGQLRLLGAHPVRLPRGRRSNCRTPAAASRRWARPVDRANLQPGDLVFFYQPVSHVGIYVGDGQMVDAGTEDTGVVQRSVDMDGYDFARRIA